ncbi:nucleotide exchange factor GrpE [Bartonella sp. TP]|uniref:nucleotide exchange factor GrpE n=1 Tax=Bartonella sp. TP TaxID=3057550 RepID=UPI0025AF8022|nr:nucleotide exchange factor GrpE [Bartonella sp. TP]WJW80480.1 nucleotide exchange factor GrpE [Bartonella sp. TP]
MEHHENSPQENTPIEVIAENESKKQGLEEQLLEAKDRILRLAAEAENIRKRAAREISDAKTYAIQGFAREMLPVCDSLERALKAEKNNEKNNNFSAFFTGVEMTQGILLKALENMQVKKMVAEGAIFDPNFHQAMFEVPVSDAESAGKVANVIQDGYTIGDRVLRPALVGITKYKPEEQA